MSEIRDIFENAIRNDVVGINLLFKVWGITYGINKKTRFYLNAQPRNLILYEIFFKSELIEKDNKVFINIWFVAFEQMKWSKTARQPKKRAI